MLNLFRKGSKKTGQENLILLRVNTGDPGAEIFLFDSKLDLIQRASGEKAEFEIPKGIYKVKVRTGSKTRERVIDLLDTERSKTVKFKPLSFSSPIPLDGTAKTHEYHRSEAETQSRSNTIKIGRESGIFVFARHWTRKGKFKPGNVLLNPAIGLSLHDRSGELLVDLEHSSEVSKRNWEPSAACNVLVDPGCYTLRLQLAEGSQVELPVVASSGWWTEIFLTQTDYSKNEIPDLRANLAGAGVMMRRLDESFLGYDRSIRLVEQARLALANQRNYLSETIKMKLLDRKSENLMLGIYGAHLLLMDPEPDLNLLNIVVRNLRTLVAPSRHPDIEALALRLPDAPGSFIFDFPTMLRRGWAIVVEKTGSQPELVPRGSLSDRISTRIWGQEPLLMWLRKSAEQTSTDTAQSLLSDAHVFLQKHIAIQEHYQHFDESQPETTPSANESNPIHSPETPALDEVDVVVAEPGEPDFDHIFSEPDSAQMDREYAETAAADIGFGASEPEFAEEAAAAPAGYDAASISLSDLVESTGLPSSTVTRLLEMQEAGDPGSETENS